MHSRRPYRLRRLGECEMILSDLTVQTKGLNFESLGVIMTWMSAVGVGIARYVKRTQRLESHLSTRRAIEDMVLPELKLIRGDLEGLRTRVDHHDIQIAEVIMYNKGVSDTVDRMKIAESRARSNGDAA